MSPINYDTAADVTERLETRLVEALGGEAGVGRRTVLGGLVLFGGMMVLLVYSDVRSLISVFVGRRYQLLIQTAFHLVLVLCAGIGVSLIVRRIERLPG